jgi:hypothetical protein
MTAGLWFDAVLAVVTTILFITGMALILVGDDLAEPALIGTFVVGIIFCLRTWWRGRHDPYGPRLIDFINW